MKKLQLSELITAESSQRRIYKQFRCVLYTYTAR